MPYRFSAVIAAATGALVSAGSGHAEEPRKLGSCYAPFTEILTKGGYCCGVDCANAQIKFHFDGRIATKTGYIAVYDMVYRFKAAVVHHGGQRIILIENGKTYLGQYDLTVPPLAKLSVRGNTIVDATDPEARIVFADERPPQTILINGTAAAFGK